MAKPLINLPAEAKRGDVIEIKTLIRHQMETGFRPDRSGGIVPRDIIHTFVCTYNDVEVFRAELFPAIAANPFLSFHTIATESGTIAFSWTDDQGEVHSETAHITVA